MAVKGKQELYSANDPVLLAITKAVRSLGYGSVIISLRDGQVVELKRHEKRRFISPSPQHSGRIPARPVTRNDF